MSPMSYFMFVCVYALFFILFLKTFIERNVLKTTENVTFCVICSYPESDGILMA